MGNMVITKDEVLKELKNAGEDGLTAAILARRHYCSVETARRRLIELLDEHTEGVEVLPREGRKSPNRYVYKPVEKEEPKMEKPERYGDNKNDEGYSDPTAATAMRFMESRWGFTSGRVYKTTLGDSFLVLRISNDGVIGYYVREVPLAVSTDSTVVWQTGPVCNMVHVNQPQTVSPKKLNNKLFSRCPQEAVDEILRKSPFKYARVVPVEVLKEVPVEIEKIVEKEVIKEVPAELTIEGCYEYLRDSGWLDEHDKAVIDMDAAKRILIDPTDLTEDICIEFLQNSGWLPEHDKEMTTVTSAIPKEVVNEMLELELLKQKASIYEEILKIVLPGFKK